MADTESTITAIGECERKICDGEALLRNTQRASLEGWFFLGAGILVLIFLHDFIFILIGLLVMAASGYRLYTASKYRGDIESGLREYRGRKAELLARLIAKE
jgi:hypothetical protein